MLSKFSALIVWSALWKTYLTASQSLTVSPTLYFEKYLSLNLPRSTRIATLGILDELTFFCHICFPSPCTWVCMCEGMHVCLRMGEYVYMTMSMCICICVHTGIYEYMSMCMFVHMCSCISVYIWACMCAGLCACMCICVFLCSCISVYIWACMCAGLHLCVPLFVFCVYVCVCVCVCVGIMCASEYMWMYVYFGLSCLGVINVFHPSIL